MRRALLDFAYDLAQGAAIAVFVAGVMLALVGVAPDHSAQAGFQLVSAERISQ